MRQEQSQQWAGALGGRSCEGCDGGEGGTVGLWARQGPMGRAQSSGRSGRVAFYRNGAPLETGGRGGHCVPSGRPLD